MRHFAHSHGTGQSRTAFKGVQNAKDLAPCTEVVRTGRPLTKGPAKLGHQFKRFFLKYREKVSIQRVDQIDVVIAVIHQGWSRSQVQRGCRQNRRRCRNQDRLNGCVNLQKFWRL